MYKDYSQFNKENSYGTISSSGSRYPWYRVYDNARQRCTNPKTRSYKNYGGRGIKFFMTRKEIKKLWFRDKAYLLKVPSIDREDNDGNYEYSNCQFIELDINRVKDR